MIASAAIAAGAIATSLTVTYLAGVLGLLVLTFVGLLALIAADPSHLGRRS